MVQTWSRHQYSKHSTGTGALIFKLADRSLDFTLDNN